MGARVVRSRLRGAGRMTLVQLRYLAAIVDAGLNITAAARLMGATQPGLSKQVKQMEDELGFQLFIRRGKSLETLTPEGAAVVDRARIILAETASIHTFAARRRSSSARVVVVGAGFSGLLTALHLLAQERGPQVSLIERGDGFGLGVAYGACGAEHLLNVRAGNMSAFPDRPDHFIDWLRSDAGRPDARGDAFVSRRTYGRYLQQLLREAASTERTAGRLDLIADEATDLRRLSDGRFEVELGMGRTIEADAVVLAPGAPPPSRPIVDGDGLQSPRYIADPWSKGALDAVEPHHRVMLLGAGLTMVDLVCALTDAGHQGPLLALSRHGLLPRRHAGAPTPPEPATPPSPRLSEWLRRIRAEQRRRGDWRPALDALRPLTQTLWRGLPEAERRRFLRHLRPYWEAHRHRLSPGAAAQLDGLIASGRLRVAAGRLFALQRAGDALQAQWRVRGEARTETSTVDWLINCTGWEGDVSQSHDPLLQSLLKQGLARPDPLALGLDVDAESQVRDAFGASDAVLTAVGPITRGAFWETTAVPDIRLQAARVAAHVAAHLAKSQTRPSGQVARALPRVAPRKTATGRAGAAN